MGGLMKTYQDEPVIAECHKHWAVLLMPALLSLVIFMIIVAMTASFTEFKTDRDKVPFYVMTVIILLRIAAVMGNDFISYKYSWLYLTDTKLIEHRCLISSKEKVTMLVRIQRVEYGNGLLGKIFGYYEIGITNAGTGHIEFFCSKMSGAPGFVAKVEEKMRGQKL